MHTGRKSSSKSKRVLIVLIAFGFLAPLVMTDYQVRGASIPSGVVYSVPITITNSQPAPTPAPFQQMISVNSASFASHEASNLQNVEFFNADGSVIPSWLESGNSNLASNTIYWVNLSAGVPAESSVTIYIGFAPISTNLFNAQATGEAPQLSSSYGQYDDGANVFLFYDGFAGTSLSPAWNSYGSNGTPGDKSNILVDNGVTIRQESGAFFGSSNWISTTTARAQLTGPLVADFYANSDVQSIGHTAVRYGFEDTLPTNFGQGDGGGFQGGSDNPEPLDVNTVAQGSYTQLAVASAGTPALNQFAVYTVAAASSGFSYDINYQPTSPASIGTNIPGFSPKIGIFVNNNYKPTDARLNWVRTRAFPPGGVMPSVFVSGSSTSVSSSTLSACPTGGTISTNASLASDIFCSQLTIASGVTLTTRGYNIIVSGSFVNDGEIIAGYPNNGGLVPGGAGG